MSTRILLTSGAALLALVTACSSSSKGGGGGGGSSQPASTGTQAGAVTISMTGSTLTGPGGRTLYANTVDTTTKFSCTGACASVWPPLTGTATAGSGVDASKLGTATRPDGTKQVTYDGHPLYEFKDDKAAGDKKGEGIKDEGGKWHVATQSGTPASAPGSSAPSGGGGSSGGY